LRITYAVGETGERRDQATNFNGASNLTVARHGPDGHDLAAHLDPAQFANAPEIHERGR
jgi:hypothetical protein